MRIDPAKTYGVITGDVIDSSKLEPPLRETLYHAMREGSAQLRD